MPEVAEHYDRLLGLLGDSRSRGKVVYLRADEGIYKSDMLTHLADLTDMQLSIVDGQRIPSIPECKSGLVVVKNIGDMGVKKIRGLRSRVGAACVLLIDNYAMDEEESREI